MQRPVDSPRLSLYFLAFLAFLGALVAVLSLSEDRGATWAAPWPLAPSGTSQVDAQIVVDPSA